MSFTQHASRQLQPHPITLSALHLGQGISALHVLSGVQVSLPKSETGATTTFKAILSESTNRNLLLRSFYDCNVRNKILGGIENVLFSLAEYGISRCAFTTTFGVMTGQPSLDDKTAPQFKVDGLSRIPFIHQGYQFSPTFFICDHIFCRQEYEDQFVAVLSLDFLREYFIRAQYDKKGWRMQLPPCPPSDIDELLIYTHGCCLSNRLAAGDPAAKPARGGYGIHFPTLPDGWDMYGALTSKIIHTNQKAELTAVIRALQLVRLRNISCARISIFTDSDYAVQGRLSGYRNAKNRDVANADLFKTLDEEFSFSTKNGIPVTLSHILRKENKKADALSRLGADADGPLVNLSNPNKGSNKGFRLDLTGNMSGLAKKGVKAEVNGVEPDGKPEVLIGRNLCEEMKPLVQWTPDGNYWAQWQSGRGESIESNLEMLVV